LQRDLMLVFLAEQQLSKHMFQMQRHRLSSTHSSAVGRCQLQLPALFC
jgi:hypothetical protein